MQDLSMVSTWQELFKIQLGEHEAKTSRYLDDLTGKFNSDDVAWYDSQHPSW